MQSKKRGSCCLSTPPPGINTPLAPQAEEAGVCSPNSMLVFEISGAYRTGFTRRMRQVTPFLSETRR